ncbi:unnamed protein product [Cyprideis torosa]|uniref:Uncharacterized protein n=1 Tax=Cyprideis torosa TaxID=163714 RepID=A0A7R8WHN9_9CRUS|nr:unnamed protein product [Cyprideis torosa]CAG0893115.1 unnamed protein product [Cyprideis torosa]
MSKLPQVLKIEPPAELVFEVMLMPFDYDPSEKNKHKFMVQSAILPEDNSTSLDDLFHSLGPDQLMDSKLRCVFVLREEAVESNANVAPAEPPSVLEQAQSTSGGVRETVTAKKFSETESASDSRDMYSAVEELRRLRSENINLRMENSYLKERMNDTVKKHASPSAAPAGTRGASGDLTFGAQASPLDVSPKVLAAAFVIVMLLSMFIGKYLM